MPLPRDRLTVCSLAVAKHRIKARLDEMLSGCERDDVRAVPQEKHQAPRARFHARNRSDHRAAGDGCEFRRVRSGVALEPHGATCRCRRCHLHTRPTAALRRGVKLCQDACETAKDVLVTVETFRRLPSHRSPDFELAVIARPGSEDDAGSGRSQAAVGRLSGTRLTASPVACDHQRRAEKRAPRPLLAAIRQPAGRRSGRRRHRPPATRANATLHAALAKRRDLWHQRA